jgi:ABC-type Fe3+ transport system permease subunit
MFAVRQGWRSFRGGVQECWLDLLRPLPAEIEEQIQRFLIREEAKDRRQPKPPLWKRVQSAALAALVILFVSFCAVTVVVPFEIRRWWLAHDRHGGTPPSGAGQ